MSKRVDLKLRGATEPLTAEEARELTRDGVEEMDRQQRKDVGKNVQKQLKRMFAEIRKEALKGTTMVVFQSHWFRHMTSGQLSLVAAGIEAELTKPELGYNVTVEYCDESDDNENTNPVSTITVDWGPLDVKTLIRNAEVSKKKHRSEKVRVRNPKEDEL